MESPFMRMPSELRLMVYTYLFDAGNADPSPKNGDPHGEPDHKTRSGRSKAKKISIQNGCEDRSHASSPTRCTQCRRSRYRVMERSLARRYFETTYHLANEGAYFCTALMCVNRRVYAETSHLVYAGHVFDFENNIEAVRPFFSDLTPGTRALVKRISLYKRGPWLFHGWSDRNEWQAMCTYLCNYASVEHLRLVVEAGRVPEPLEDEWEQRARNGAAPRQLSSKDVALLVGIRHEMLDWVGDLVSLKNLRDVEVLPDFSTMPLPETSDMVVFMALSASLDKGLKEFLRERMGPGY